MESNMQEKNSIKK